MRFQRAAVYVLAGLLLIGLFRHFSKHPVQFVILLILIGGIWLYFRFPNIRLFMRQFRPAKSKRRRAHLRVIDGRKNHRVRSSDAVNSNKENVEEPTRLH